MMRRLAFLLFLTVTLVVGGVYGIIKPTTSFTSKRNNKVLANNQLLTLRGGAGPLDPMTVAKVYTVTGIAQGFLSSEAPEACLKAYGGSESSPVLIDEVNEVWVRTFGEALLAFATTGVCLFFHETSIKTALGCWASVWAAVHTRAILTQAKRSKFGENPIGRRVWALISYVLAYACLSDADYAMTLAKGTSILTVLAGTHQVLDPAGAVSIYGYKNLSDPSTALFRGASFWILAGGVFSTALTFDVDPLKAYGYAAIVGGVLGIGTSIFNGDVTKMGLPVGPYYFWLTVGAIVAATLAI